MRFAGTLLLSLATLTLGTAMAVAYNSNPPSGKTGAPSEGTCRDCHSTNALNQSGKVELLDAPMLYRAGNTYRIRARVTTTNTSGNGNRRWGFEVTAINSNDGTGTGTFANVSGTSITTGSGGLSSRTYIRQTNAQSGQTSPAEWSFDWTAPAAGNVPVAFYVSGVAGNGSGSSGDWVYTNSWTAADTTTDVRNSSWGEVKARYRR